MGASTGNTKSENPEISAGLDIGTTKVSLVIARRNGDMLDVIGLGTCPSNGLKKGMVINIDATVEAIKKAREEAELMAGVKIDTVWVGIAGNHIRSFNSRGMVAIKNQEVQKEDVARVLEAARAVALPPERELIHSLAQSFAVDAQEGIRDPVGMSGVRLEAGVHIVTGLRMSSLNLTKCVERAGLNLGGFVLEPLASAEAILSQDEKDLGVAVVDMGGGTCDIIIYSQGAVVHTSVLPIGGMHISQDVSVGLRTPLADAEEIKKKYGCAMTSLVDASEAIDVPGVGGRNPRTVSRTSLAEVIEPRVEETLHLIQNEILKSGYQEMLGAGVVLTGGGSLLEGVVELGEFIFDVPVRRGVAMQVMGLTEVVRTPIMSTAVGLTKYGTEREYVKRGANENFMGKLRRRVTDLFDGML